jgi:acyl-CoA synthetase (AMP-forming)/AMP-acid ligase II
LCDTGPEFVAGFYGCLCAGVIAVPAASHRLRRGGERLQAIADDAGAQAVVTTSAVLARLDPESAALLSRLVCLPVDEADDGAGDQWREHAVSHGDVACLQYTSGSTGWPKGVMLTHRNFVHNAALIDHALRHRKGDRYVSWLPLFHDMGLMVGVVLPVVAGLPVVLMSPGAFLQRPARWLEAISRYRATISGGPDFAYELCVRRVASPELSHIDLRRWTVAFNGAEPVRADTIDRFSRTFAHCGFRRQAFYPCYGLAEATLAVACGRRGGGPAVETFDQEALQHGTALRASSPSASRPLVGCGRAMSGQLVVIVDPESGRRLPQGYVGEVWVSGRSVAAGYWRQSQATAETFGARLMPAAGTFLRTGDLGFLSEDGELFITGRLTDVVILNGCKHHPQDIERTAEGCHPALKANGAAAFAITLRGEERVVVVHEVDIRHADDPGELKGAVRQAVAEVHEIPVHEVVLVRPGAIPRTSSGKIRRARCRDQFLAGALDVVRGAGTVGR